MLEGEACLLRAIGEQFGLTLRDGRIAGYLVSAEAEGEWNLREAAAADGRPETLRAILESVKNGLISVDEAEPFLKTFLKIGRT